MQHSHTGGHHRFSHQRPIGHWLFRRRRFPCAFTRGRIAGTRTLARTVEGLVFCLRESRVPRLRVLVPAPAAARRAVPARLSPERTLARLHVAACRGGASGSGAGPVGPAACETGSQRFAPVGSSFIGFGVPAARGAVLAYSGTPHSFPGWRARLQDSGQGRAVNCQEVLLRTMPHSATRGPSLVRRQAVSPTAKVRPCARQKQFMGS
jgi:hypothetical protein